MNHDLVDQPPDQLFIILLDDSRLFPEEDAHFGVSFTKIIPTDVLHVINVRALAPVRPFSVVDDLGQSCLDDPYLVPCASMTSPLPT